MKTPEEVFPEYFLIRVNEFNKVASTPLEEWLDYLKNGRIKDNTTTPGLAEARKKLQYMQMTRADQIAYERHLDAVMVQNDSFDAARLEGRAEGLEMGRLEGMAAGRSEEKTTIARNLKQMGLSTVEIEKATGLKSEEIDKL